MEIELTERDYFGRYLGMNDPTIIRRILSDHGHCPSERWVARLVELKFRTFVDLAEDRLPVVQAACSLIRTLVDSGSVVGVVSGASRQEIELGLSELDVKQLVSFIVSAEDAPRSKPDPQGYLQALSRVRQSPMITAVLGECYGNPIWMASLSDFVVQMKGSAWKSG